jgi:hypothetical protein
VKTGTSTGGVETSKRYERKRARKRAAEQKAWDEQNGPVILRLGGYEVYLKSNAKRDVEKAREMLLATIASGIPQGDVRPSS